MLDDYLVLRGSDRGDEIFRVLSDDILKKLASIIDIIDKLDDFLID